MNYKGRVLIFVLLLMGKLIACAQDSLPFHSFLVHDKFVVPPDIRNVNFVDELKPGNVFRVPPIYFDFNASRVLVNENYNGMDSIRLIAEFMNRYPGVVFQIRSHTDFRGSPIYNKKLTEHRAKSVLSALIHYGVDSARVYSIGMGYTKPIIPKEFLEQNKHLSNHEVEQAHQYNRRMDLKVIGVLGDKQDSIPQPLPPDELVRKMGYRLWNDTAELMKGDRFLADYIPFFDKPIPLQGREKILEQNYQQLLPALAQLQNNQRLKLKFTIHTDTRGSDSYNKKFSQTRADELAFYLKSLNIDPSRFEVSGEGSYSPLFSQEFIAKQPSKEHQEYFHQLNRRIEVEAIEGKPKLSLTVSVFNVDINRYEENCKIELIRGLDAQPYYTDKNGLVEQIQLEENSKYLLKLIIPRENPFPDYEMKTNISTYGIQEKQLIIDFIKPSEHNYEFINIPIFDNKGRVVLDYKFLIDSLIEYSDKNPGIYISIVPYVYSMDKKLKKRFETLEQDIFNYLLSRNSKYIWLHENIYTDGNGSTVLGIEKSVKNINDTYDNYAYMLSWTSGKAVRFADYKLYENNIPVDSGIVSGNSYDNSIRLRMRRVLEYKLVLTLEGKITDSVYFPPLDGIVKSRNRHTIDDLYFQNIVPVQANFWLVSGEKDLYQLTQDLIKEKNMDKAFIEILIVKPKDKKDSRAELVDMVKAHLIKKNIKTNIITNSVDYNEFIGQSEYRVKYFYGKENSNKNLYEQVIVTLKK
jgi:outer membrane protein OmpA-like peptidoglycan-associated protein